MSNPLCDGVVDWTGENPFAYLKSHPEDEHWSTLATYYRINASDHGTGHAMLVLEDPDNRAQGQDAARLCLTDNLPLAHFLIEEFASRIPPMRGCAALDSLRFVGGCEFGRDRDASAHSYAEWARSSDGGLEVMLTWEGLGSPFAVDVPPASTPTGEHELFSVFQVAESAYVSVNGRKLPGSPVLRDFFRGPGHSAALAFSETWLRTA